MAVKHFSAPLLSRVKCPSEMGQLGYIGRVVQFDREQSKHMGRYFQWVTVERLDESGEPTGQKSIWPSTRLQPIN